MKRAVQVVQQLLRTKPVQLLLIPFGCTVIVLSNGFPWVMPRSFLVPAALMLFVGSAWFIWKQLSWLALGALIGALIALLPPAMVLRSADRKQQDDFFISMAQVNVHEDNKDFADVVAAVRVTQADLLSLQEVDGRWQQSFLDGLAAEYPWQIYGSGEHNYGIALFSKVPLEQAAVIDLDGLPAIRAVVRRNGKSLLVIAAHLRSPENKADWMQRNRQWKSLAHLVAQRTIPVCLLGDLNTVPWDAAFTAFEQQTGMQHGPFALVPTWTMFTGIPWIPLDHVLTTSGVRAGSAGTFVIPGSDHRGIAVRIFFQHTLEKHLP